MCDCKNTTAGERADTGVPVRLTRGRATLTPIHERAVLCWVCPHAREAVRGMGGPIAWLRRVVAKSGRRCGVSGQPIVEHLARGECPRARFTREARTTRCVFVAWLGLPLPLRWLAWAAGKEHPRPAAWDGCGCMAWAKDLWERVVGRGANH